MKRGNLIIIFLVCFTLAAFAQNDKKPKAPNLEKAKSMMDKGDLAGAKDIIDYALIYDKTKDKSKTHYYAGLLYQTIFEKQDSGKLSPPLDAEAFSKSISGFKQVEKLENQYGTYYNFADLRLNQLYQYVFNKAAKQYQNDEYDSALINFDRASSVYDHDTTAIMYAGYAAQQSEKMDIALKHFKYLADNNMADANVYRNIIYIERNVQHDTTAALQTVDKAIQKYPDNKDLKQDQITMMILTHQVDSAKKHLMDEIEKDPNNYMYYYELGYIYDNEDDYPNSVKYYGKCLEINPDYFEANYNLGVKHYNEGAKIAKKANFMSVEEYQKSGKQLMDSAAVYFRKALPYFEKCHQIQPKDVSTVQTLAALYGQLKMKDKADEMNKLLDTLSPGSGNDNSNNK